MGISRASAVIWVVTTILSGGLLGCSGDEPSKGGPSTPPLVDPVGPIGERDDLPVAERIVIENLSAPVDVVRDKNGRPHVYASNLLDVMRVEGYLVARDRPIQLELTRRAAEGRTAELFGSMAVEQDIVMRHAGLGRVAAKMLESLPADSETKRVLEAYADGISQVFRRLRNGEMKLPVGGAAIATDAFTDWTELDSLTIGRYQSFLLSYDATEDLYLVRVLDAARSTFTAGSMDPAVQQRVGIERDLWRFAPAAAAFTTTGYPMPGGSGKPSGAKLPIPSSSNLIGAQLSNQASGYITAMDAVRAHIAPEGFGSNGWVVGPSRSSTGHAVLASDPHLGLGSPATFWPFSFEVVGASENWRAAGVAFPGVPGIALGHNDNVAWGATVAGFDVTDVYAETLSSDASSVVWKGNSVPLETIDEVIAVKGAPALTYRVYVVPHHGPIIPTVKNGVVEALDPAVGALSVRWTGHQPSNELGALLGVMRSNSVDEVRNALASYEVGPQNWMIADSKGNIAWTSQSRIPMRDPAAFAWDAQTYTGTLPCMVLPGDGSAEWTGFLPETLVPRVTNPASGYIATANNDPIGETADNDPSNGLLPDMTPMYLHCAFDVGFREARIQTRIEQHVAPMTLEEQASIQADVRSALGSRLTPRILESIDKAEAERQTPGTHPDLAAIVADAAYNPGRIAEARAMLAAWGTEADYEAASGIDWETGLPSSEQASGLEGQNARASKATLLFNLWLVRMFRRTFGDELSFMGFASYRRAMQAKVLLHLSEADPKTLATYNALTMDSVIWDDMATPEVESRHERMIRALLDALTTLDMVAGADIAKGRWGTHHTVQFAPSLGLLSELTIPPTNDALFSNGFPRPGDLFAVDVGDFTVSSPIGAPPNFDYNYGPAQRFVVDLDPAGPRAWNALPGGAVEDPASPHFRDEAEFWRKNQTHPVPFSLEDVVQSGPTRIVATPN
jgi:penicillin G amidase